MRVRFALCLAPRFLCYASILYCCLPATLYAQGKPLGTEYLECVRDNKGRDVASRSLQTPVFDSKRGFKAYGVVIASYSPDGACKNTSTIYLAEPAGTFRVALRQTQEQLPDGSVFDGNGIEALQWSPSGTRLFIAVSQWTWGSDIGSNTKYILLTPSDANPKELPIVAAIQKHFAHPCVRLVGTTRWLDDTRIGIEINPGKDVDEEGKTGPIPSCVRAPTQFSFDVNSGDFVKLR